LLSTITKYLRLGHFGQFPQVDFDPLIVAF
jgi:hypothetical protein